MDQVILEVLSNVAFCDSDIFAPGRCGLAIKYLTAMCGKLTHQSQRASQKFGLIQKCPWMAPPHCCPQDHAPPHSNESCLKMAEEINTHLQTHTKPLFRGSFLPPSWKFAHLNLMTEGTAWMASGASQGLELGFYLPV